ncbi:MAG: hypothetical protein UW58_C0016G0015 [Candidatus Collierbacteria bacterium GW2011_GWC2_44_30]|nr:MAG: hypothetical protein UW58_C0016G0015 [Candidatus Collierbacteria bacterium GW2011_GWC2_44_30]
MFGGRSAGISLPVTMSRPLYICRESAERMLTDGDLRSRISDLRQEATERAREVLPEAVGPQITRMLVVGLGTDYFSTGLLTSVSVGL